MLLIDEALSLVPPMGGNRSKTIFCVDTTRSTRVAQFMGECSSESLFEFPIGTGTRVIGIPCVSTGDISTIV